MPVLKHLIIIVLALSTAQEALCASISSYKGEVEYKPSTSEVWRKVEDTGRQITSGDEVRTKRSATAEIALNAGSAIKLDPSTSFKLAVEKEDETAIELPIGKLRAWVKKVKGKFELRTPRAICAVRGTEFSLEVDPQTSNTQVDLFRGTLEIRDNLGNEMMLQEGRRLSITQDGMGAQQQISQALENERQSGAATLSREVGLAMSKESVLAAAAEEIKLAEYQQGKALVDVFGNRVQLEEYIMRPAPDQFKLVVLNKRENRLDYFFYKGTFNTTLPTDLSLALKELGGMPQSPNWYLTSYQTGRSNTTDSVEENASGGHIVDVNSNLDSSDDVASYFDATADQYVPVSGAFYKTLFDYYSIKYNGTETYAWAPNSPNVQTYLAADLTTTILGGSAAYTIDTSFPDGTFLHNRIRETYGTGDDYTQYDNYIIDNDGKVASVTDFVGVTSGPQYRQALLNWNFQQVITSSFFGNRKIDLVVEPKILIQSGLVQ